MGQAPEPTPAIAAGHGTNAAPDATPNLACWHARTCLGFGYELSVSVLPVSLAGRTLVGSWVAPGAVARTQSATGAQLGYDTTAALGGTLDFLLALGPYAALGLDGGLSYPLGRAVARGDASIAPLASDLLIARLGVSLEAGVPLRADVRLSATVFAGYDYATTTVRGLGPALCGRWMIGLCDTVAFGSDALFLQPRVRLEWDPGDRRCRERVC